MTKSAINVEDVVVKFRPYLDRKPTLRRSLNMMRSRQVQEITALDHVSFRVGRGEAFGIVGRNGAGKSTLLRVLAGTLRPDEGKVVVNGRTSTLLQLGVGFNTELSGRRNVYLGGLAAGLRKTDVDLLFDDIVTYAELGDAIDRALKTYSSGMFARLAFSIGIHLDPEILLLDEILAVGDEGFRAKSMNTMKELVDSAGTIVYVSHNLGSVAEFCERAIWFESGRIASLGPAKDVVDEYREATRGRSAQKT